VLLLVVDPTSWTEDIAHPMQPEGEEVGQEGPQAEGEEAEVLPVGRQKTALLRRLNEELRNVAFELQTALADTHFPEGLVSGWLDMLGPFALCSGSSA
jgi:hypothetical protein